MATPFSFAVRCGNVPLSENVATQAEALAREYFHEVEAQEFSGDGVETIVIPDWAPRFDAWFPQAELTSLGLQVFREAPGKWSRDVSQTWVATVGVDPHTDELPCLALCYVLHNDKLAFKQGRNRIVPIGGDWFVFDYQRLHEVKESKQHDGVFLAWTVPIQAIV